MCGSGAWGTGGACRSVWGDLQAERSQQVMVEPLNEVLDVLGRIHIPLIRSIPTSGCWFSPSCLPFPTCTAHDLVSWKGQERNRRLWQCVTQWGKQGPPSPTHTLRHRRNHLAEKGFLGTKQCCLRGDVIQLKLFLLLPFPLCHTSALVCSTGVLGCPAGLLDSTRVLLCVGDCLNQCSPGIAGLRLRGTEWFHGPLQGPHLGPVSVCLLSDA